MEKRKVGSLNVLCPRECFDWRVSVSQEVPCECGLTSLWLIQGESNRGWRRVNDRKKSALKGKTLSLAVSAASVLPGFLSSGI